MIVAIEVIIIVIYTTLVVIAAARDYKKYKKSISILGSKEDLYAQDSWYGERTKAAKAYLSEKTSISEDVVLVVNIIIGVMPAIIYSMNLYTTVYEMIKTILSFLFVMFFLVIVLRGTEILITRNIDRWEIVKIIVYCFLMIAAGIGIGLLNGTEVKSFLIEKGSIRMPVYMPIMESVMILFAVRILNKRNRRIVLKKAFHAE